MRRGTWAADPEYVRSVAVDNIAHVHELMGLGIPEGTIYRRCRTGGPWTLMAPATVRLGTGTPTRRELVRAALVYAGPQAVLTGLDAARAHGLRRGELPAAVHLLIPFGVRLHATPIVRVERTRRLPTPPRIRDGFPVASIERSVLDVARTMTDESDIAALLSEPVQRRLVLPESLVAELEAGCRKGSSTPRRVLRAVTTGARSAAEFDFLRWWNAQPQLRAHAIVLNVRVSAGSEFLGIADGLLPDLGLVLPIDSTEHHFMTPEQVTETERQHRAYRSAGLHVYGVRPMRMRGDPGGLLRDVLDAIAVAEQLPTPSVLWTPDLPRPA
ncbi:hypothetical protein [Actinomycetospora soli]|uniref:hypothetical protein n=1 Tax=Actinomycetospora soli TaxID=2893887 RepID=UPI001E461381|nr:hypothetical protein [Actinomycetospora soli]MCD2190335.1 hypothetical protein [Actinomycetospora soli]